MSMTSNLEQKVTSAIHAFCEAAIEKGTFASPAKKDHQLHKIMSTAVNELRTFGSYGLSALKDIMQHESPYVRIWAATEMLTNGDETAKAVLISLAAEEGLLGASAKAVLNEHVKGRLRSPFSVSKT